MVTVFINTIDFDSIFKTPFVYLSLILIAFSTRWKKQENINREVAHALDLVGSHASRVVRK